MSAALPMPRTMRRTDSTRTPIARERSLMRKASRAARTPMPLDLDRLSADLSAEWMGQAR